MCRAMYPTTRPLDAAAGQGEVLALADDVADLAAACAGGEPSSEAATALLQDGVYSPVALYNNLGGRAAVACVRPPSTVFITVRLLPRHRTYRVAHSCLDSHEPWSEAAP